MADYYSDEERAKIYDEYAEALEKGTPISKELAQKMADAELGIKGFSQALWDSKVTLGKSIVKLGQDLNRGEQGAEVFIDAVAAGAVTAGKYAQKISKGMLPDIQGLINNTKDIAKAVAKQSDDLYKANQAMTRTGLLASGGMTEVYNNMQDFGYNVDTLDEMVTLMKRNSVMLAQFGDSAYDGMHRLAQMSKGIMESPDLKGQFMNMGMTVDQIDTGQAAYLNQLTLLGRSQTRTGDQLFQGSLAYLKDMDALSRITGQTRDEMADDLAAATDIDTFAATLALAEKERPDGSRELQKTYNLLKGMDPSGNLARGMAESLNGFVSNNEQAQQLYRMTNGKSLEWGQELRRGEITSYEYADRVAKAYNKMNDGVNSMTQAGVDTAKYYGKANDRLLVAGEGLKDYVEIGDDAREQTELAAKGTDALTDQQTEMRQAQLKATQGANDLLNQAINPLTEGLATLADTMDQITGSSTVASQKAATPTTPVGTSVPPSAPPSTKYPPNDALTGKSLDGVQPNLAKAISLAAADYKSQTGKQVTVTSAFRSYDDQVRLYNDYISGRSPYPAGKPGRSKHEQGLAVDVTRPQADALDQMGLLAKYGLNRPVANDPVHIQQAGGYKTGGIATGPLSGYSTTLHGTEAVIPLTDSKKIPVQMTKKKKAGFITHKTVEMLAQRAERLETIIRLLHDDTAMHEKILMKHS